MKTPLITEAPALYGYLIGLHFEKCKHYEAQPVPVKMYATFEFSPSCCAVWGIPDFELFECLSEFLLQTARFRANGEYGYANLWISKQDGGWHADLP